MAEVHEFLASLALNVQGGLAWYFSLSTLSSRTLLSSESPSQTLMLNSRGIIVFLKACKTITSLAQKFLKASSEFAVDKA